MLDKFRETVITWDKANRKVYEPLRVSAGDNKGRKLSVQLVNDGVIEDLSGASLSLFWETRDKAHKGLDAFTAVDATKGEFEIYYTTGMLSNEGTLNANLVLVDASGRIVSEPFEITVFRGINDDAIQSSDSFTALTEALAQVGTINNKADRAELLALESTFEQNKVSVEQQLQQTEQDLTAQLAEKAEQEELEGTNKRIDSLVIPLSPENANIEVTDSHVSIVKNKTFPSLRQRLEETERDFKDLSSGSPLVNEIKNANFYDTSNWESVRATLTASNNELKIEGNYEDLVTEVNQQAKVTPNRIYYLSAQVKSTSDKVAITVNNSSTWRDYHTGSGNYERLSTNYLVGSSTDRVIQIVDERISDSKDAVFVKKMIFIDLTSIFGEGNEPSSEDMDVFLINYFPDGWFNGGASLGGYFKYIETELGSVSQEIEKVSNRDFTIPILESDPINPKEGQMWIVKKDNPLLRELFTETDGSPLNPDTWDVVKSGNGHHTDNGVSIQSNQARFTVASTNGTSVGLSARMRKFKVDWSGAKRVISWEQQPHKWFGIWGLFLSNKLQTDGGTNLLDYAIRVVHRDVNTSLQMKNAEQTQIVYDQSFAHGATGDAWKSFRLEITDSLVELYMGEILQLTATNPDIGVTGAWLYFYAETTNESPTVKRIDNVVIV